MYHAELHNTVGEPWTDLDPIRVGPVPSARGTPGAYLTIERNGEPLARVDAWPLNAGPFVECVIWRKFVALGWGGQAHLIDPIARDVRSIEFEVYFRHFHPLANNLLVASESDLTCLDSQRDVVWRSGRLGIDGVVVDRVVDGLVIGRGDWDPPNGWRPFRLSIECGCTVAT